MAHSIGYWICDGPYEHPFAPIYQADNTFQIFEKISHQFTGHSLKAGVEFPQEIASRFPCERPWKLFVFAEVYDLRAPRGGKLAENAFADFLLGTATSTSRAIGFPSNSTYQNWWGLFLVQDDWKVYPNLTLNLGLRYELHSGAYERLDRFNTFCIDKAAYCRVVKMASRVVEPTGTSTTSLLESGSRGAPSEPTRQFCVADMEFSTTTQFRIGCSTWVKPRHGSSPIQKSATLTFQTSPDLPAIPSRDLSRRHRQQPTRLPVQGLRRDFKKTAYVQQWSIGIQQEIFRDTVLEVAYVANRGIATPTDWNLNYVTPGLGSVITRRPYQRLNTVTYTDNSARSWYDSMQVRVERAFRSGFTVTGAYTWAKSLAIGSVAGTQNESNGYRNPTNFAIDKGPGPSDIRHRLVVSAVAELPFGRGRRFS